MTSNFMSIGTNTEPFPLSDEKGVQTSKSAIDAPSISSRTDENIRAVEDFPYPIPEHRTQAQASQPQPPPDVADLQQQRYFSSFSPPFPSPSSSSLSSSGSSCPCRDSHILFPPNSFDQRKAVPGLFPSSNGSCQMTGPLTLPLAPPLSQKKRQRQMQENARTLLPLSFVQPVSDNMIDLSVHLFEDPDSPSHSTRIWVVQRDSENTFSVELWNDGYTFVSLFSQYRPS
ncbi:hypothetical protein H2248_001563 [Termitomyces sp. 'cryptogamus']|nr:hypothetical protein H2248_001563 [Termitomyces sp. 'cryptogamus']